MEGKLKSERLSASTQMCLPPDLHFWIPSQISVCPVSSSLWDSEVSSLWSFIEVLLFYNVGSSCICPSGSRGLLCPIQPLPREEPFGSSNLILLSMCTLCLLFWLSKQLSGDLRLLSRESPPEAIFKNTQGSLSHTDQHSSETELVCPHTSLESPYISCTGCQSMEEIKIMHERRWVKSGKKCSSWPRYTGIWFSDSKNSLTWKTKFTAPDLGQACCRV